MHLFETIRNAIIVKINDLVFTGELPNDIPLNALEVVPPKDPLHGDIATNAAMIIAGKAKQNPRAITEKLKEVFQKIEGVDTIEIAGPGFINMRFAPAFWYQIIPAILEQNIAYGDLAIGQGKKVNVEYVSANPTGPLHIGHARGAVYGDALSALLQKAGYDVTKEYYMNDAGSQVDVLAQSAYLRYREVCGESIEITEGLYPGDYLIPTGGAIKAEYGDALLDTEESEWLPKVKAIALASMMELIKSDLKRMGIEQDVFTSEQTLRDTGQVEQALQSLEDEGLIYTGVLEPPKGKQVEDWEARPQTLFKATEFGDDVDRPVKKADGDWTYFAPDIAYHYDKYQRGFNRMINVFGADHGGYVKRLKAVVKALTKDTATLDIKLCQLVKFLRGGEPAKMSKRAGTFVTAEQVVEEVGKDAFRFIMLTRKNDAPLDFDFDKVLEQSKDNPVFYVQYAHARAHSVIRNAKEECADALAMKPNNLSEHLSDEAEFALVKLLAGWPRIVESAAQAAEPHRIAFYLQEVASVFHGLWNKGNSDATLRFILQDQVETTAARLMLVEAMATVIASGLYVLGVEPVEEMR
jgi:arginyl-tRNA synthetase